LFWFSNHVSLQPGTAPETTILRVKPGSPIQQNTTDRKL